MAGGHSTQVQNAQKMTSAAGQQPQLNGGSNKPGPTPDDFKAALELHHHNLKQGQAERDKRLKVIGHES